MSQLVLENLTVGYGNNAPVIQDLHLNVPKGSFYAMVGPSGSGKTSILRAIGGFVAPTSGTVRLAGKDVTGLRPERRNLGIVFQDYALFPHMTVEQNVAFGLRMAGESKAESRSKVADALALVGLDGFGARYPDQLSGGQQQRVALARALVIKPDALLLDEPLSALDRKIRLEMQIELRRIQRETGITAIIVTHDQQEAMSLADELLVLK
nr:ABC transporter ATP-binding protein [Pseudomonas sp.]